MSYLKKGTCKEKQDNVIIMTLHAVNTEGSTIQSCIYMNAVLVCWLVDMLMKLSLVHPGKLQRIW